MRRTADVTAVVDVLPSLQPVFDYVVIGGRVCAHCIACGERFDTIGRTGRAIVQWAIEHSAAQHARAAS